MAPTEGYDDYQTSCSSEDYQYSQYFQRGDSMSYGYNPRERGQYRDASNKKSKSKNRVAPLYSKDNRPKKTQSKSREEKQDVRDYQGPAEMTSAIPKGQRPRPRSDSPQVISSGLPPALDGPSAASSRGSGRGRNSSDNLGFLAPPPTESGCRYRADDSTSEHYSGVPRPRDYGEFDKSNYSGFGPSSGGGFMGR